MRTLVVLLVTTLAASAADPAALASIAEGKIASIQKGRLRPGSQVSLSPAELDAYVTKIIPSVIPQGVRRAKLGLGNGVATGSALINFAQIRGGQGKPPGWLAAMLLDSEHPVTVKARIESRGGRMQVDPQRVEISGISIDGKLLDYLVTNYLHAFFPTAKVGTPFELGYGIDRVEVRPDRVTISLGR